MLAFSSHSAIFGFVLSISCLAHSRTRQFVCFKNRLASSASRRSCSDRSPHQNIARVCARGKVVENFVIDIFPKDHIEPSGTTGRPSSSRNGRGKCRAMARAPSTPCFQTQPRIDSVGI